MDLRLSLGLRLKAVIHLKCSEWQLRAQSAVLLQSNKGQL